MITVEALREYGANVEEGLSRCFNKEDFYIKLVSIALKDENVSKLDEALKAGDLSAAFEAAHALKGMLGNLSLAPLFAPVAEVTELLRSRQDADYESYMAQIRMQWDRLKALESQP